MIDRTKRHQGSFGPVPAIPGFVLEAEAILLIDGKPDPDL
jgi:hypothetical protein